MATCLVLGSAQAVVVPGLAVLLGIVLVGIAVVRQPRFDGKPQLLLAMAGMVIWMSAVTLELWVPGEACKVFWARAAWPGIALLPTAWTFFLHDYAFGAPRNPSRWRRVALLVGPLTLSVAALSNPWHGAFYTPDTRLVGANVVYGHGPLFYLAAAYLYGFMMASVGIGALGAWRAQPAYRAHFLLLLAATCAPLLGNLAYVFAGVGVFGFDPTAFLFSITMFVFVGMLTSSRPFDIASIGREVLFRSASDPVVIFGTDGRLIGANPGAQSFLGVGEGRITQVTDCPHIGPLATGLLRDGTIPEAQVLTIAGRGFVPRAQPIERPLGGGSGVMGWVIGLTDITAQQALQRDRALERDFLAGVMATDISGVVAVEPDGRIAFVNASAERLLGLPQDAMTGRTFDDLRWGIEAIDGSALPRADLPVARVLYTGAPVRGVRMAIRWPDGTRRALSVNATPLRRPDGAMWVVCSVIDITEQLAAEDALRATAERAEAASRAKSAFLANMSHEIRTPMNGVLGMAEILADAVETDEQRAMVATIRDSGALLLNILNDILDMSKIEAGKLALESVAFVPAELVRRIAALHQVRADEKGLTLTVSDRSGAGGPGQPAQRLGDPHRVMQILHNLVGNAIKFTETGAVRVEVDASPGSPVRFTVIDSGIGMSSDQIARVFDEFEQADSSTTRRFGGTGLGMTIVRRLIAAMGGSIAVESAPGQGATIRVDIPLPEVVADPVAPVPEMAPQQAAAKAQAMARQDDPARQTDARRPAPAKPLRILAADDSATNRMVLKAMLTRQGAEVTLVADGVEAVAAALADRFDLLLLDIAMPGMDGVEALGVIRARDRAAHRPGTPALAITANVLPDQVQDYLAAGFDGFLGKPIQGSDLAAAIARAMGHDLPPVPAPPDRAGVS